ncbi:MAG: hypothetical protein HY532_02605 [Chloroflexi bacterium]|nr:hypothetical protein [Chloroflexota bacterium]
MHSYSVDSNEHEKTIAVLAAFAVLLAWLVSLGANLVHLPSYWWVSAPSAMSIFWGLYALFDKRLWKWSLLQKTGWIKTPDLNGLWEGKLESSFFEGSGHPIRATLRISQTWTRIGVLLETSTSSGRNMTGAIILDELRGPELTYEFQGDPGALAPNTMHVHRGTARLFLKAEDLSQVLAGEYYTGRDRQTFGTLSFTKTQ